MFALRGGVWSFFSCISRSVTNTMRCLAASKAHRWQVRGEKIKYSFLRHRMEIFKWNTAKIGKKKIAACVTRDRDSLGRRIKKPLGSPLCRASPVCFFFSFCNIVRRGESGCFSLNFLLASFKRRVLCLTVWFEFIHLKKTSSAL